MIDLILAWQKQYPHLPWAALQELARSSIHDKNEACARLAQGYPLAYLIGSAPFGPANLQIVEPLLIPRQETWDWLERILPIMKPGPKALDLGCGPGTISWALGFFFPKYFDLLCVDINPLALKLASCNLDCDNFKKLSFLESNWFQQISPAERFDLIISNPPYCDTAEQGWMYGTEYEDKNALFADFGGLSCYQIILEHAGHYLADDGSILLEHGASQGASITKLTELYHFKQCIPIFDHNGAWRASWIKKQ